MSVTLVVMQPTVLPWAGYFQLLHMADDFVIYDDVQLEKRSWQTRNRLLLEGKPNWITVPIVHAGLNQKIIDTHVVLSKYWIENTHKSFARNYAEHEFYNEALEILEYFINSTNDSLARKNESTIKFIADRLNLETRIHRASELGIHGNRSDRLIELCKYFNAKTYLSPIGASEYLAIDGFEDRSPAKLIFQNFKASAYTQKNSKEFIPNLSIIDVVANLGWKNTRTYILGEQKNEEYSCE
jgi:hypothetical protein